MWRDFRDFIVRGNVMDLAIGIIIGAAFSDVVNSLVNNIIMAPLGALLGQVDFTEYYVNLSSGEFESLSEAQAAGAATINYGLFISDIISFLIIAAAIFLLIKGIQQAQQAIPKKGAPEEAPGEPLTKECPYCFTMIPYKALRCPNCTTVYEETA